MWGLRAQASITSETQVRHNIYGFQLLSYFRDFQRSWDLQFPLQLSLFQSKVWLWVQFFVSPAWAKWCFLALAQNFPLSKMIIRPCSARKEGRASICYPFYRWGNWVTEAEVQGARVDNTRVNVDWMKMLMWLFFAAVHFSLHDMAFVFVRSMDWL